MAKQNKNILNWLIPKCSTASDIQLPLNKELDSFENYSNNPTSQIEDSRSDVNITVSFSKISNKDHESTQVSSNTSILSFNKKESIATASVSNICKKSDIFKHYHRNGKHFVRCEICYKFPNLVKAFSEKNQIPNIAQECGAIYRNEYVNKHLETKYHLHCEKAIRLSTLPALDSGKSSIDDLILKSQSNLANKIGSLLIHVYGDAKKLTLSAQTFPVR